MSGKSGNTIRSQILSKYFKIITVMLNKCLKDSKFGKKPFPDKF